MPGDDTGPLTISRPPDLEASARPEWDGPDCGLDGLSATAYDHGLYRRPQLQASAAGSGGENR